MREVSKSKAGEEEVRVLKDELAAYRDALVAAFGIYTANPRATLLSLAREWEEDREALLALTGQRCVICQAPATREIPGHDTFFCDEHEFDNLPGAIKEALGEYGVGGDGALVDIAFANAVRRAMERCVPMFGIKN